MPRAVDPSLMGQQIPITHSPLNRIDFKARKPDFDLEAFLKQVEQFIEDFLFPVIKDLTGIDMSIFLPLFKNLDMSSPIAFAESLAEVLLATTVGLLGPASPLNALNLFNLVPSSLLGMFDVSHIGTTKTNLVADPNFIDATPIPDWIHSPTGGFGGTGMRTVTADGLNHELLGNLIPVSKDQVVPVSAHAKWTALTGTGNPVALGITGYKDGAATDQPTLASHSTTPHDSDWVTLSGSYTVPDNVDSLRTRLIVGPTASAGYVSFSTVSATKTGPMRQGLIAGTDIGTFLPDDIENLFGGIISNTLEILDKASQGDLDGLITELAGDFDETITGVGQRLQTFLDSLSPLNGSNVTHGSILDQFLPGVGTLLNNIFGGLFGVPSTAATHDDAASALAANASSSTDHGAGITDMFSRLSSLESKVSSLDVGHGTADGGALGVSDTDDFERVNSSGLGPLWLTTYSGGAGVWATPNGHDAEFAPSGITDREFLCIRNNPDILKSQTDYQRVTSELSSASTRLNDPLGLLYDYSGCDDIWLRVSDDTVNLANITGVRIRWAANGTLSIYRFVAGAPTLLKELAVTQLITPPGPGANLVGEAGVLADGSIRTFRAKVGTATRLQVTEVGTASGLGVTYRRWGHGGKAPGFNVPFVAAGQAIPGGLHFWNGMDQTLS